MDWYKLVEAKENGTIDLIGRSQNDIDRYKRFRKGTLGAYVSTKDQILISIFNCDSEMINSKTTRATSLPSKDEVKVTLNRFPYHVNAHHFLVWFGSKEAQDKFVQDGNYTRLLPRNLREQPHFCHINKEKDKTVPDVEHIHLFVKKH